MKATIRSKLNLENRVALQEVIPLETPYLIYLDPSSVCNFKCQFCPTGYIDMIKRAGYRRTIMEFELFRSIIDSLDEFPQKIKVLRMNKIGEPFLNRHLPAMIAYAKKSGRVEYIDLATNGSLFDVENMKDVIEAGIDRINISIEGVSKQQYLEYSGVEVDYEKIVQNVKWLFDNKEDCEITIKIPGNYITEKEEKQFFETFGNYADRIFIENLAPIWPGFELEKRSGLELSKDGQYGQLPTGKEVCTYIFYSLAINADGTVSACCPDWEQKLIVGNAAKQSLREVWNSENFKALRKQHLRGERLGNTVCALCGHIKYCQIDDIDQYKEIILRNIKMSNREKSVD